MRSPNGVTLPNTDSCTVIRILSLQETDGQLKLFSCRIQLTEFYTFFEMAKIDMSQNQM